MASRFPFTAYPSGWFRIAASSDLAPGDVQPRHYFGRDLVLFRTVSGTVCLLDAHCPHMGAHLGHGGKVMGECIQCPWHGWRTAVDGGCKEIPYSKTIPAKAQIRSWPVREVNGVILAYNDLLGRDPDWSVAELPEYNAPAWTPFRPGARWRLRTHVQELCENGMDSAHFSFLHPQQTRAMRTEAVEIDGPVLVHRTFQHYNIFGLAKFFVDQVNGPLDITYYGLGMVINRTCVNAKIQLYYTFVFFFTPIDDAYAEVNCMLSMKKLPTPFLNGLLVRKAIREGKRTIDQDVPIWENKRYYDKPLLCDRDGPIMRYRRWARQFYPAVRPPMQVQEVTP